MSDHGPIGAAAAQQAAAAELRKAMYHRGDPNVVERILDWLGRHLDRAFGGTIPGSAQLALLALLVTVAILAVVRAGRPRRIARTVAGTDPLAASTDVDHRLLAQRLAAEGRYPEAVREWLRAAVATIERRGVLDPRPGRTGAEIARAAGVVLPSAAPMLIAATTAFDEIWFGTREALAADVATAQAAADAVQGARIEHGAEQHGYAIPR
ncbi:MAG TPA: DUF4129 domain-containing protein [Jatrophihabitantaceae bacterium]|nr:DUF4129 domain-containing protein [Jatrophihabitantaceae bacterium]